MEKSIVLDIDTKEPEQIRYIVATFAKHEHMVPHETPLTFGDYSTNRAICERKTAVDLLESSKGKKRLFRQLGSGLVESRDFMLLVTGVAEPIEAVGGLIASVIIRYPDYKVIWVENEPLALLTMVKWFKKKSEDIDNKPHLLPGTVIVAKLFGLTITSAQDLMQHYNSLFKVVQILGKDPNKLLEIYGIGEKKLTEMKQRVLKWQERY